MIVAKVIAEEPPGEWASPKRSQRPLFGCVCSDAAAFMVGHAMVIDGGQTVQERLSSGRDVVLWAASEISTTTLRGAWSYGIGFAGPVRHIRAEL
jgi:hypothetical protein